MNERADIAIIGLGSAALQFAKLAQHHPAYTNKKIVFIDSNKGASKSWCFWHKGPHLMDEFVSHEWKNLCFGHNNYNRKQKSTPYTYRYISSVRMFNWFFNELLPAKPKWSFEQTSISDVKREDDGLILLGEKFNLSAEYVLDSRLGSNDFSLPLIWQHFRGFLINSDKAVFDSDTATFMDFSLTHNNEDPSFVYVLPFSSTEALVETTVFSNKIWQNEKYDEITRRYIDTKLPGIKYEIQEVEVGRIPMAFLINNESENPKHIKIGGATGCIKPTTGYAFQRISKSMNKLVDELYEGGKGIIQKPKRFDFYDSLLLDIIQNDPKMVEKIMAQLFRKNSIATILEFLDEESSFLKEAGIFSTLPIAPFLKAIYRSRIK